MANTKTVEIFCNIPEAIFYRAWKKILFCMGMLPPKWLNVVPNVMNFDTLSLKTDNNITNSCFIKMDFILTINKHITAIAD